MTDKPSPGYDFSEFGPVTTVPLTKIQTLTGKFMSRNWTQIPHVTHHDEADVSDLETARVGLPSEARPSLLALTAKAVAQTLAEFPKFNASLDVERGELIFKAYVNLGFAIDTPNGLVVGVVRNCDGLSPLKIGRSLAALAAKAREKGLSFPEMSGGGFTLSSLGARGGVAFSPIINAPEVAILGLSRLLERPMRGPADEVLWRTILPLSLSYDHRVINGADAANFSTRLRQRLADPASLITSA